MDWLKANFWEIKQSSSLRWLGFLLALSHLITFFLWTSQNHLPLMYYAEEAPMCWSFFENCGMMRFLSLGQVTFIYYVYPILALLAALMLIGHRLYGGGWFFLLIAFGLKSLLYFQDSRLSNNAHYLLFVCHIIYLFIPQKKAILKYLIVSFIVTSGLLKLNADWLSGMWIHHHTGLHLKVCEWLAALSALAELILPWLIVSRKSQNVIIGFLSLVAYFVAYFLLAMPLDPVCSLLFLSFYPAYYMEQRRVEMEYLYRSYIRPEASQAWVPLILLIFWSLQAFPFIKYQNPNVNLIAETFALQGYPAAAECYQTSFASFENETRELGVDHNKSQGESRECDPFVRFLDVKALCHQLTQQAGFQNIASSFVIRGLNDKKFKRIFESNEICNDNINFRTVGQSKWNLNLGD
ncbi:MAG: hypothetical protein IPJ71_04245 [Bdellovibrionales bacterium]|nr:hypothetical protein [Bdellovibrionales bacterium]